MTGVDKPFPKAKEGLAETQKVADVAIVSSANGSAVFDRMSGRTWTCTIRTIMLVKKLVQKHMYRWIKKIRL